jgi:hypothetical protein
VAVAPPELVCLGAPVVDRSRAEEQLALGELAGEVLLAGRDFAVVLVEPACVAIHPRLDLEARPAERVHPERAREAVVAQRGERLLAPAALWPAVAHDRAEHLVAVPDDRRGHVN